MKKELNNKEKVFVQEYLVDLDTERAALAAGYSRTVAHTKAYQWVSNGKTKPHVLKAIKEAFDSRAERTQITQDMVLREYAKIAFFDPRQLFDSNGNLIPLNELPADVAAALTVFDVKESLDNKGNCIGNVKKIKFAHKPSALNSLAKHLGMFVDRMEHGLNERTLGTILGALPTEYAERVKQALTQLVGR